MGITWTNTSVMSIVYGSDPDPLSSVDSPGSDSIASDSFQNPLFLQFQDVLFHSVDADPKLLSQLFSRHSTVMPDEFQ